MRTPWTLVALLSVSLVAGCFGAEDGPRPTLPPPLSYSQFRCVDGSLHPATPDDPVKCNVRITQNAPRFNGPANELTIAVDPTNPLRLTAGAKDYTLGPYTECGRTRVWSGYYWSTDGGYTWGNNLLPGHDQGPQTTPQGASYGYHCISDPVAYWDNQGNAYYSGLAYNHKGGDINPPPGAPNPGGLGNNLFLARSTDGGKTYEPAVVVVQGSDDTGFLHDKQWFTIDYKTGNIYFTWSMFATQSPAFPYERVPPDLAGVIGTDQLMFTRSIDGGKTWSPPRTLYESSPYAANLDAPDPEFEKQFSMPQVDADGGIHVTWRTDANTAIWYTYSADQGVTWTSAKMIVKGLLFPCDPGVQCPPRNSNFRTDTSPVLAIDRSTGPNRGHLYVAFAANATPEANVDVFVIKSADKGATWSAPGRVNDDLGTNDQLMPWLDVGPQGDVHVVFVDRRYDPKNYLLDLTYAHSTDGVNWDPNLRVTEVSSDAKFSLHQSGREFIGDYLGVMEGPDGRVHPIWVDTRHGVADAFTAVIIR